MRFLGAELACVEHRQISSHRPKGFNLFIKTSCSKSSEMFNCVVLQANEGVNNVERSDRSLHFWMTYSGNQLSSINDEMPFFERIDSVVDRKFRDG